MMPRIELHKSTRKGRPATWVLRHWDGNGKRPSETIGQCAKMSKREAQVLQRAKQSAMDGGKIQATKPEKMTLESFKTYHEDLIVVDLRDSSVIQYACAFGKAIDTLGKNTLITAVSAADVGRIKKAMNKDGLSLATIAKTLRQLRAAWNRALAHDLIIKNPFAKIGIGSCVAKASRIFEKTEIVKLIEAAPDLWWRAFLSLAFASALRRNELLNLRWEDVDLDSQTITVQARKASSFTIDGESFPVLAWSAKATASYRTVPIPADACLTLKRLQAKSDGSPYLFLSCERLASIHRRMNADKWSSNDHLINNFLGHWHAIQRDALGKKIKLGTIHDMRKTCLTHLASVVPMHVLRDVAGHASINTTAKFYTKVRESDADLIRKATTIGPDLRLVG